MELGITCAALPPLARVVSATTSPAFAARVRPGTHQARRFTPLLWSSAETGSWRGAAALWSEHKPSVGCP
jgi:hypothetical protein